MEQAKRKRAIYLVGGSKGGVGKSITSMALLDYLVTRKGELPILVESDTSNPDVYKSYHATVPSKLLNLDETDGWIELINLLALEPQRPFVLNTPGRSNDGIAKFGTRLAASLEELESELVTFWVISRQRDSIELLHEYLESMPGCALHVVRNTFFGEEPKFERYNESKMRKQIEARGGRSLSFPDLADRVAEELYSARRTIAAVADKSSGGPLGNRIEMLSWRTRTEAMFAPVIT